MGFLDKYKKKEKNILGSQFGGGWDLPSLKPEEEEEKKDFSFLNKYKFAPTITEPIKTQPTDGATLTMLPSQYKIRSLALKEEYERKALETPGISQRMRGIGEIPLKYPFEGITIELSKANERVGELWWSEFRTTENKWKFLRHENWSEELILANREAMILSERASKMGVNIKDWINYGVYAAFFATVAAGVLPILSKLPANILNNLTYKVGDKTIKGKKLFEAIRRVNYPDPRAGFGAPSKLDKQVFAKFVEKGGLKGLGGSLKKGITITEVTPRFAFGTKLYAGLPADEIVKTVVEIGKVTAEMVKGLDPVKVSQVTQQLLNINPALATEFLKAVEQIKVPEVTPEPTEIEPLIKEEIPTKTAIDAIQRVGEAQSRLDPNRIIRESERLSGRNRMRGMQIKKELEQQALQDRTSAQNDLYEALEPKHHIGDIVTFEGKKVTIESAVFKTGKSAQQMIKTGFPASFAFDNLVARDAEGYAVNIYPNDTIDGELLSATIKKDPEEILKQHIDAVIKEREPIELEVRREIAEIPKVEPAPPIEPVAPITPTPIEPVPVVKPEKVNPMAFSNDPLAISRELESYPDDSVLMARKAELIFKQHLEGKEIDYPINIAKQELELAKTNLVEKFGNNYPEAEKIIKRAEILEKQLVEPTPTITPKPVAPEKISIEDDYRLIDKWIQQELPKQKAADRGHKLKAISKQIRDGNVPDNVLEAMHRQFDKTKDQETGEMLWWDDVADDPTAYPRTGTLMDFYTAYENLDIITEPKEIPEVVTPVPPIEKVVPVDVEVKPEVKPVVKPEVAMATKEQEIEAHAFAKKHKLITETPAGKISDIRFKRIAKIITGKTSVGKMTEDEADEFIEAIKGVVQRQPWEPPIIPLSSKIVPKDFFDIEFKDPTIWKYITPKDRVLRNIGAEDLVKDVTEAHAKAYLKGIEVNAWIDRIVIEINKKAPVRQKIRKVILAKPTDRIARFRDLLDTYKTAPDFLSKEDQQIFTQLRNFTKTMLEDTNKVRVKLGLNPIREIETYIPHFLDELTKQIVNKKYPFPEDVKYWIGRNMPKKIYNPTEMERRVKKDLDKFFSRDLGALLKVMSKYDLRDIYLSEPYSVLRVQLNALGDKIPAIVRKEIDDYMRYDIFSYPVPLDIFFNATVKIPVDVINILLRPFNRVITNPAKSISNLTRRGVMMGALAFRPRIGNRNLGQRLLIMDLYQPKYFFKAQLTKMPEEDWAKIKDSTFYRLSRKFEDVPLGVMNIEQWGLKYFQLTHAGNQYFSNVDVAMKAGYYYAQDMVQLSQNKNSRYYKYAERYAKKHDIPLDKLLWKEEDILWEAEEAGSLSQWLYFTTGMPQAFRGYIKRAVFTLQSWLMNYLTKHLSESYTRTFTGRTSRGKLMRPIDRLNWLKGTAIIMGVLWGLREAFGFSYERFLLPWGIVLNTNVLSPVGQILAGTFNYITARNDWERTKALWQIKSSWKVFIPGSLAWKDAKAFLNGEISLKEYLFYVEDKKKEEEKKKIPSRYLEKYREEIKPTVSPYLKKYKR